MTTITITITDVEVLTDVLNTLRELELPTGSVSIAPEHGPVTYDSILDEVRAELTDYEARFRGLLADFEGHCTQTAALTHRVDVLEYRVDDLADLQADDVDVLERMNRVRQAVIDSDPTPPHGTERPYYRMIRDGNVTDDHSCGDLSRLDHVWEYTSGFRREETCMRCGLVRQEVVV